MSVKLSDVAARAGVSPSAVSKVLANSALRVRPETRARIVQAAVDLNYRPNYAARALKSARSRVLAMIVPDLTNAIFTELMRGVEDAALKRDYVVLLGRSEDMQPGGATIARLVGEGRVDGILLQLGDGFKSSDVQSLLGLKAPVVFMNSYADGNAPSVSLPNETGAALATQHLIDLGHRDIGFAGGITSNPAARDREKGFVKALQSARLPVHGAWLTRLGYNPDQGRAALRAIMGGRTRPTALVVANINAAMGLLAAAREAEISIPTDLSVVAIHDAWTAETTTPPLSTVAMPLYELGQIAVDSLVRALDGETAALIEAPLPGPSLIIRGSSARAS